MLGQVDNAVTISLPGAFVLCSHNQPGTFMCLGKETFLDRMDDQIERVKRKYPDAQYVGITDGAKDFRPWLEQHTTTRILDFWHVTEYINDAAPAIKRLKSERSNWIDQSCHDLKHTPGAATSILTEFKEIRETKKLAPGPAEK